VQPLSLEKQRRSGRFKYQPAEADARETGAMLLEYDLSNLAVWNFSSGYLTLIK
jgi:hypothetical protein